MSDEPNEEQKTSGEQEVKSDELAEDVLDDASGGAAYVQFGTRGGEASDKDHKAWTDLASEQPSSDVRPKPNESIMDGELNEVL